METNQNETIQNGQMLSLIQQLLETIRDKGVMLPVANPSPLDEIWSEISSDMVNYRKRMDAVVVSLQTKIGELEQENAELKTTQKNQDITISTLKDDVAKMSELKQENDQLKKEIQSYEEQRNQMESLRPQVDTLSSEKDALIEQNGQLSERIKTLENENKELTTMIQSNETELVTLRNSYNALQSQLDTAQKEGATSSLIAEEFQSMTAKWKALLEKVFRCQSMKKYCEDNGLKDDGKMDTLLHFISLVGDKTGFARTVKNILTPDRNTSDPPAINSDAIGLIQAVNTFYREKYGEELVGDVLFMPEGFSFNQTTGQGIHFNQTEMQQFKGNNPFVCKVLTPGYRGIDGSVDKAYVL